ncbi:MAG: hypothetical protein NTV39_01665 [Candidatus Saccharibacteria bacterium]|nr:hypothetical protein [Candidatus Saccharibacteria bacterium]
MEYRPPLKKPLIRLVNGRLIIDDGFSIEEVARDTLEWTKYCGGKNDVDGFVRLILPYKTKEEHHLKLDVYPGETLDSLIQRIRKALKDVTGVYSDVVPFRRKTSDMHTFPSLLFGS